MLNNLIFVFPYQALDKCQLGDIVRAKQEKLETAGQILTLNPIFMSFLLHCKIM